jgi:hypothetical protein
MNRLKVLALYFALAGFCSIVSIGHAHPYASGVSGTNGAGFVSFIMNEDGATVNVVFEDGTSNSLGVLPKGPASFNLGTHTSFRIICSKAGTGTPSLISSDSFTNSSWNSPRGVDANKNPRIGSLFGRLYIGNSTAGGTVGSTFKGLGLYALNADQTEALGKGTNATATTTFTNSGGAGPWRLRIAPDNTVLVNDFSTTNAALWQFQPDLDSSNLVLSIIGQDAAASAGIHGDMFGTPLITGSLAASNLVLWTADGGMAARAGNNTNGALGPGTSAGSYNCVFRYDIGAGPLPWNKGPNYAYTVGLDGLPDLRVEVELGKDGKIMAGFGRANLSNPSIQILNASGTTLLYTSGVNPPNQNTQPTYDPWNGVNGSGSAAGLYAGIRVSPDGIYLASVDIENGITIAKLTNGIPDDGTIFGIANPPITPNARGMCWDAADNIWMCSSGQQILRCYSLGVGTICITSNDWTGTNGTFTLLLNHPPTTAPFSAATRQNQSISIATDKVLAGATDPDNDPLTISAVSATSMNGGSVSLAGGNITYTPTIGFIGVDQFGYTVSDSRGGSASSVVAVQVRSASGSSANMFAPVTIAGGFQVSFLGIAGRTYSVQRATNLAGPWIFLASVQAGPNGFGVFADTNAPPVSALYRTTYP